MKIGQILNSYVAASSPSLAAVPLTAARSEVSASHSLVKKIGGWSIDRSCSGRFITPIFNRSVTLLSHLKARPSAAQLASVHAHVVCGNILFIETLRVKTERTGEKKLER